MRAVAIMLVLLGHVSETLPSVVTKSSFYPFFLSNGGIFSDGRLGVNIFFVISGYLITKLLIIEKQITGRINLKYFFRRRVLRIFPVFYLYIIVLIVLKIFFIPTIFESYMLVGAAALYLWNYLHLFHIHTLPSENGDWFFGHFWSLSLEEQFYIVWPLSFINIEHRRLIKVVIAIIVITPIIRVATYFFMPGSRGQLNMMLQTGGSTIFVGCLGAMLENTWFFRKKISKLIDNKSFIAATALFLFIITHFLYGFFRGMYTVPLSTTLASVCIMVLVYWVVYVPSPIAYFLNKKIIVKIGMLSYSLYIWQQLFLTTRIQYWFTLFPQNIFLVVMAALISYYGVEKPILQLKAKFKRV